MATEEPRGQPFAGWRPPAVPRERPTRKKLNAEERRALRAAAIRLYEARAGRRAQKRREPNDRAHDREVEQAVSRMDAFTLARLLAEAEEGTGDDG